MKEKLDKCVKDKLIDFCDVLNIPINKAAVKKVCDYTNDFVSSFLFDMHFSFHSGLGIFQEELSAKLLEFLESPHSTTDVLLADKEQVVGSCSVAFVCLFFVFNSS